MGQSLSTEIQTFTVTISWSLTSMPRPFKEKRMISKNRSSDNWISMCKNKELTSINYDIQKHYIKWWKT